ARGGRWGGGGGGGGGGAGADGLRLAEMAPHPDSFAPQELRSESDLSPRAAGLSHMIFSCPSVVIPAERRQAREPGPKYPGMRNSRETGGAGSRVCSAPLRCASCCAAPGMTIERPRVSNAIALPHAVRGGVCASAAPAAGPP